ncbi:MAG: carbon monoxide dehydrogenase accessory protein CooC [Anaerolineae bacterium]|nr:carbon monoxide dehydrogenase accessory protein CooC [Anaerolineae bacterium]MDW8101446.1 carbon monoxide dehydrogenase accessory protein CooC [Anaerolineae bacterium]
MPKIAISGKGGVGKSTLAALLAYIYARKGFKVIAVDADPDGNLAVALGFPQEVVAKLTPIARMEDLIEERTGARPGSYGVFFKMNPKVDDIPDRFAVEHRGIKLLVMGTIEKGGSGCVCPESVLLKNLVAHLLLQRQEVLIMDMEAGVEHLGRATARAVDAFIIVVEPGLRSLQTAHAVRKLAADIGVERVFVVGNKIKGEEDKEFLKAHLPGFPFLGFLSYSPLALEADKLGRPVFELDANLVKEAEEIVKNLEENFHASEN